VEVPNTSKNKPNHLVSESSPYLLQHAYNPVEWRPFTDEAFALAKAQNKPLLISIGYSACHWCHVMEKESFEDAQVAAVMNRHFINVKVDREERTDVDMLYMHAVQLMTGHGGWPLNCFVLPDGRPFYGGTYFPRPQWLHILHTLAEMYDREPLKVRRYAEKLEQGIVQTSVIGDIPEVERSYKQLLRQSVEKWKPLLDNAEGGMDKAPKFPMPNNYLFLLRYAVLEDDEQLLAHVRLTLLKMAFGGIYDHVHGGFSRYSTDAIWKVPHFEKMLYDNAQLVSLYTEAFLFTGDPLYRQIAEETASFVLREWTTPEGGFYSAYDADSEGVEGKYYVWSASELRAVLKSDYEAFSRYFEINDRGYWEDDNYILMRSSDTAKLCSDLGISREALETLIAKCSGRLARAAAGRVKPGLDNKVITSWNALMCSALAHAFLAFGDEKFRDAALASAEFLTSMMRRENRVFRIFNKGEVKIDGFLDDYAFFIDAMISCHLVAADEKYLVEARTLTEYAIAHFSHENNVLFYYTSDAGGRLITRQSEMTDNVIPASNSQMALNLARLGEYFGIEAWKERAARMLSVVATDMKEYGSGYSNWAMLALYHAWPVRQVSVVGKNVEEKFTDLYRHGIPNAIFALSRRSSEIAMLKDKYMHGRTLIYVCSNDTCSEPVTRVKKAIELLA
jgi:uncharacterized protein